MKFASRMFWVCVISATAAVTLSGSGGAQTVSTDVQPPLEKSLLQAIREYDEAQLHGNRTALEQLVADDYLIVRPRGVGDKASLIANMSHAGLKLEPFTILKPFTRNYGNTVVTGGWAELKGVDGGKSFSEKIRFADVWSKREGRWRVVMTTLTPAEAP